LSDEPDERLSIRAALRAPPFWLLITAATAAMMSVPWWITTPLALSGLLIASLPKYIELWPRARNAGAEWQWWNSVALSTFNSLAAACAAHMLGIALRWLWWS
jgi:hypothetical protein